MTNTGPHERPMPEQSADEDRKDGETKKSVRVTRRGLLTAAAASAGGVLLSKLPAEAQGVAQKATPTAAPAGPTPAPAPQTGF